MKLLQLHPLLALLVMTTPTHAAVLPTDDSITAIAAKLNALIQANPSTISAVAPDQAVGTTSKKSSQKPPRADANSEAINATNTSNDAAAWADDNAEVKHFFCSHPGCSYSAKHQATVTRHALVHTGEKPFKCKHCEYSSTQQSNLSRHERIHTGEKPFKCQHCAFSASAQNSISRHERIHTGKITLTCQYCGYSATNQTNLSRHERSHTGKITFDCKYCGYSATDPSTLSRHERSHTGEKPFCCRLCPFSSAYTNNMKRHEKRMHRLGENATV